MTTFTLLQDENKTTKLIAFLGKQYFVNLSSALYSATNYVQKTWIDEIKNSNAKRGWKVKYAQSIQVKSIKGEMSSEIFTEDMYANFVEKGIKRFDMKPGLLNGPNAKQGKNGPYNIVFFRKGATSTQNIPTMPSVVYTKTKQLPYNSSLKNVGTLGMTQAEINKSKEKGHKSGMFEGLTKLGQSGHSQYGTFRVITKKSKGWIYPGSAPVPIFPKVKTIIPNRVKEILNEGLKLDIKSGLQYLNKR